ncbi:MAG: peptidoglycan-binding protein [Coleofasciculaceae cyanobacterium]
MTLTLKVTEDTVFKQKPIESTELSDKDKHSVPPGTELELENWKIIPNAKFHIQVILAKDSFQDKRTWYAFTPHVQVWQNNESLKLDPLLLKDVTSCSTVVVRALDRQIIQEMNSIRPGILVSFADLNVNLDESVWPYLQPAAKRMLERAIKMAGQRMTINSAYRTIAQQQILYNHYLNGRRCGIQLAAQPPRSNHQSGLAIDTPYPGFWMTYLQRNDWRWLGRADRVHFDYKGFFRTNLSSLGVLAFQRLWNRYNPNDRISEDGAWGGQTQTRLNNSLVSGFQIPYGEYRTLKLLPIYMQGEDVRQVQNALFNKGLGLEGDGIYGPGTEGVVKQFQRQSSLLADGIVGAVTRAKLGL